MAPVSKLLLNFCNLKDKGIFLTLFITVTLFALDVQALAAIIKDMPNLAHLSLQGNTFTNVGAAALATALKSNQTIKVFVQSQLFHIFFSLDITLLSYLPL